MDPLSEVLSLMIPRSFAAGGLDGGGAWSIAFPEHSGFKCYALASGHCWLAVEGAGEPALLQEGDCFILPHGRPFRLASDLDLVPIPYSSLHRTDGVITCGAGCECFIVGAHFALEDRHAGLLLRSLAAIVHIHDSAGKAALRSLLDLMRQELVEGRPGASLIAQHLAQMILVQALRLHAAQEAATSTGWLFAVHDRQIGAAVAAVHSDLADRWTLQTLSRVAGMSRSSFAQRFKALTGETPMDYVTRWRMLRAGDRLTASNDPVVAVAQSIGYGSESAFSTAFKRIMGCSPRRYRRSEPALIQQAAG